MLPFPPWSCLCVWEQEGMRAPDSSPGQGCLWSPWDTCSFLTLANAPAACDAVVQSPSLVTFPVMSLAAGVAEVTRGPELGSSRKRPKTNEKSHNALPAAEMQSSCGFWDCQTKRCACSGPPSPGSRKVQLLSVTSLRGSRRGAAVGGLDPSVGAGRSVVCKHSLSTRVRAHVHTHIE